MYFGEAMIINESVEISVQKGMFFRFKDGDIEILYKCSSFSGKERVEVNGRLISEAKNFKKHSMHSFTVDGVKYSLQLLAKNLLQGDMECSLNKNGSLFQAYKLKYVKSSKSFWIRALPSIICGLFFGIAYGIDVMTLWVLVITVGISISVIGFWNRGQWECEVDNVELSKSVRC